MNLRGRKKGESKARPRRNRKSQSQYTSRRLQVAVRSTQSQFAVAVAVHSTQSQVMQVDAVASQMLTLRGNECLNFVKVQKGLYTKVRDYVPSDPEHIRDNLLDFPTSSCLRRTHPYWRATVIWFATNWDLRSHRRVDF